MTEQQPNYAGRLLTVERAVEYVQAGNARVTLRSMRTGNRFTYRIRESEDGRVFFVSLLTGSDNESSYQYLGIIKNGEFTRTAKSRTGEDAPGHRAFAWAWGRLRAGNLPAELEIWHEGSCGRCGRTLTVPESIEHGFGPECIKHKGEPRQRQARAAGASTTGTGTWRRGRRRPQSPSSPHSPY